MVTWQPVLAALGWRTEKEQAAFIKLMAASGAFGELPDVTGTLSDREALAILTGVKFENSQIAAQRLHELTQHSMLRRPPGAERYNCEEPEFFRQNRGELLNAAHHLGMLKEVRPHMTHCRDLVVLGAMEGTVSDRLETVDELHKQGLSFDNLYLLGSERPLNPDHEPLAKMATEAGSVATEMQMMRVRAEEKWPEGIKNANGKYVNIVPVTTPNQAHGRANTADTAESYVNYLKQHNLPLNSSAIFISDAPNIAYQNAAMSSRLPPEMQMETVGARIREDSVKIGVIADAIARQIDVGFPKLLEALKDQKIMPPPQMMLLKPTQITIDPASYQYRSGGDAITGATHARRIKKYNPTLHSDTLIVHRRFVRDSRGAVVMDAKGNPKTEDKIADGHHRHEAAVEAIARGEGPENMAALVFNEKAGYSRKFVKHAAARKNIAQLRKGPADPVDLVDAAKAFREEKALTASEQKQLPQLNMQGNIEVAYHLHTLNDASLEMVKRREIPAQIAAEVAKSVNPDQQESVIRAISTQLHQNYPDFIPKMMSPNAQLDVTIKVNGTDSPFEPRPKRHAAPFKPAENVLAGILARAAQPPGEPCMGMGG